MSIFNKIEIIFGSAVILLLLFFGSYYLYNDFLVGKTLKFERKYSAAASEALSIKSNLLHLRKLEKEFMISRDPQKASEFNLAIGEVIDEIFGFQEAHPSNAILAILHSISNYHDDVS